ATARQVSAQNIAEFTTRSGKLSVDAGPTGAGISGDNVSVNGNGFTNGALAGLSISAPSLAMRGPAGAPQVALTTFEANAKEIKADGAADVTAKAATLSYQDGGAPALEIGAPQVAIKSVALNSPLDVDVAFDFNKQHVAGTVKLGSLASLL